MLYGGGAMTAMAIDETALAASTAACAEALAVTAADKASAAA